MNHADIPCASWLPLRFRTEKTRRSPTNCTAHSISTTASRYRFVAVGTADQVVEQLNNGSERGTNHFNIGAIGNMPHWKVVKNLTLLGQDVIPRTRAPPASAALPLNKQG